MSGARALVTAARLPVAAYFLLSATYLLLAFIPFTYVSLIQSQVVPALVIFARAHPYLHWVAVVLVAATFARELRGGPGRLDAAFVLLMLIAAGVWLFLNKPLAAPRNDRASLILALGSLVPLLAIAIVDFASSRGRLTWLDVGSGEDRRQFHAAWQSAILTTALYLGVAFFRYGGAAFGAWPRPLLVCVWALSAHLALFMGLFVAAQLVRGLARVLPRPAVWEFIAFTLAVAGGVAALLVRWVFPAIAFRGPDAWIAAGGAAVAIAATLAGLAIRGRALDDRVVESGLELALSPLAPGPRAGLLLRWVFLAVALALSGAAVILAARLDWNQLLQRIAVVAGWLLVYAAIYSVNRPRAGRRETVLPLLLGAALGLGAFKGVQAATPHAGRWLKTPTADMQEMVEDFAAREPAFGVLYGAFTRRVAGSAEFYRYLQRSTNIPHATPLKPVDLRIAPRPATPPPIRPDIYIISIDSLRQDYVSPYNPVVTFTPAIQRFAAESTVFPRAFTRYGATGLSEASLWAGAMPPHKQYVTPFAPMNTLQRLLREQRYQPFVSVGAILRVLLERGFVERPLDQNRPNQDFSLCRSLAELQDTLVARQDTSRPVFAYTQPQDLHVSVISRRPGAVDGADYGSFNPAYASRVRVMDACFGGFIEFLKSTGLYNRSLIVLTSDHGDSLGEGGRFGHAYTIFPEILRIPLIVHLPDALRSSVAADTSRVAFLTDISPTLHYLLDYRPVAPHELFGRPLFAAAGDVAPARGEGWLVASSYGPVYGVLGANGETLFISDAVNYREYYFDLLRDPTGSRNLVTPAIIEQNHGFIRQKLETLNRFYGVP